MGKDYLMENNIGIAYGAVIENAIGGGGDDRINGNQVNNRFTGGLGADTFIIADYSGATLDGKTFDDESVDTIVDFSAAQGDKISLCELDTDYQHLSFSAVTGGTMVTVERGNDDLSFIVLGNTPLVEANFTF
jgi:Ca2+-binding RTX toxin-like protein